MSAKKVLITQTRSSIRQREDQKATLRCLGLGRIGRSVEMTVDPSIVGMIRKVSHLVVVKEAQ